MVKLHKIGQNPHLYWFVSSRKVYAWVIFLFPLSAGQSVKVSKYDPEVFLYLKHKSVLSLSCLSLIRHNYQIKRKLAGNGVENLH